MGYSLCFFSKIGSILNALMVATPTQLIYYITSIFVTGGSDVHINKCMKCHSLDRDVLFSPCGHVTVCSICSSTVTSCSLCDTAITSKTKVQE